MGLFVSKPGVEATTADRTDRSQFLISTDFTDRRPFRILTAGQTNTNTAINLPGSVSSLGGEPLLVYRPMTDSTSERAQKLYGVSNDGSGNAYSGSEFYNRLIDGNPAYFIVYVNGSQSSTVLIKYMVLLF
ncbi:hypothetical protein [Methylobacterium sp. JK268]